MSLAACQWVWDECPAKNGERLVLLALAVFADDNGRCFCQVEVLMAKTRMCKRNVGRAVDRCVEAGWLEVEQEARWQNGIKMARDFRVKIGGNLSTKLGDNLSEMGGNLSKLGDNLSEMGDKLPPQNNKKNQNNQNTGADAPAPAASQPSLPSSPTTVPRPKPPKFDPATISLPHGAGLANAWAEFAQHRREIKAPLTPTAAQRIVADLAAVNEANAVEALRKSVKHGWRGVFLDTPKDTTKVLHIPRTGPVQPSEAERRMLALEALQAERMQGAA